MGKLYVFLPALLLLLPSLVRAEEEEAVRIYKQLKPSVVSLQNVEGSGTGILVDSNGLILTNAHVISSPLPFKVKVATGDNAEATFTHVQIVGYHPRLDLALVKIDPKEQHATLKPVVISRTKADPGQHIYVIGNPGAGGMILTRTITSGMISGVDREVEGEKYYQTDAAINPGNSGGPVCDHTGKVLGVVTFKFTDVQATGFAIPLYDVDLKSFVPITQRQSDPKKAADLVKAAERYAALAERIEKTGGAESDERNLFNAYAAICYRQALIYDPANPAIYYNVGMLLRTLDENEVAAGYLTRAVELEPWDKSEGNPYRELGLTLAKQQKDQQALAAWGEGIAKSPYASKIWEDLAIYHQSHAQYTDAAVCAATALLIAQRDTRVDLLEKLEADARSHLTGSAASECEAKTAPKSIVQSLDKLLDGTNAARKERKLYITSAFSNLLKEIGTGPTSGAERSIPTQPLARLKVLARFDGSSTSQTTPGAVANNHPAGSGWIGSRAPTPNTASVAPKTNTPAASKGGWVGSQSPSSSAPKPQLTGRSLARSHRTSGDALVTVIDAKDVADIAWSADGKFAFILEKGGLLHKVSSANLIEERQLDIGSPCTAIARAKTGLVVGVFGSQQTWLLDDNLELKRRIPTSGVKQVVASPAIPIAYATGGQDSLSIIDTESGAVHEVKGKDFEQEERGPDRNIRVAFWHIAVAPDGKYLFVEGSNIALMRFRIKGRELVYDGASPMQADNVHQIVVSSDSQYVAVLAGAGNHIPGMARTSYATYVMATDDITRPATIIESGAYPQALGFDAAAQSIYAQNFQDSLIVYSGGGQKQKQYKIAERGSNVHRFVVHPAGHKLFVLAERLYWVELP